MEIREKLIRQSFTCQKFSPKDTCKRTISVHFKQKLKISTFIEYLNSTTARHAEAFLGFAAT